MSDKFTIEIEKRRDLVDDWDFSVYQDGKRIASGITMLEVFGEFLETMILLPYMSRPVKDRIEERLRAREIRDELKIGGEGAER